VAVARIISYGGGALLLLWLVRSSYVLFVRHEPWTGPFGFNPDEACQVAGASCGAVTGIVVSLLTLAAATSLFLLRRLRAVVNSYGKTAKHRASELVPTAAGGIVGDVVGRNDLCQVIVEDLRDSKDRRPHILIGSVGTGKTAVLVLLTQLLARCGATPVPIRLRDAQDELNFQELARTKFMAEVDDKLLSESEGDRIWRYLLKNDRIVVLADGLEEALSGQARERDRDNMIRLAIRRALKDKLPLVIASRPHDPLRGADAAMVELEPLSRMAALDYLGRDDRTDDSQRLNWIVETADVAEAPLFLRITRELHDQDLLRHLIQGVRARGVNTRSLDRSALRLNLLDTWLSALIDGRLHGDVPLTRRERLATVAFVAALAAEGLRSDSLEVQYDDVIERLSTGRERFCVEGLGARVKKSLGFLGHRPIRMRLAATWGARLGLIEAGSDAVRFHHSVLQAYLGSLVLDSVIAKQRYLDKGLREVDRPGREFLIALVFLSRRQEHIEAGSAGITAPNPLPGFSPPTPATMWWIVQKLMTEALHRKDNKSLDMFAAALEIDSVNEVSLHPLLARRVRESWNELFAADQRTLDEAKLGLVHRFGDALRQVQRRADTARPGAPPAGSAAYYDLYEIGCLEESSYAVRHAVAQELGSGGRGAFNDLRWELGIDQRDAATFSYDSEETWRRTVMRAWLAPLLLGSVDDATGQEDGRAYLRRWIEQVGDPRLGETRPPLPASLEMALAQGFTYAANRRRRHPHMNADARSFLVEQAADLLKRSHFWAAQLTLIHALCLWALPDNVGIGPPEAKVKRPPRPADPHVRVRGWLDSAGTQGTRRRDARREAPQERTHPFVEEAAALAVKALETEQPERFLWIDVFGITSKIGSRSAGSGGIRRHNLWIPPSVGWSALDPRAQQLVADVLLLINLADRGEAATQREQRLRRAGRQDLPPCLTGNRRSLDPERALAASNASEPGENCVGGCPFQLCPYPPKGVQSYRAELSDAFCRRQQTLLGRSQVRKLSAPWQGALPGELRRFWGEMALRARR
jgi:hypothetical protein